MIAGRPEAALEELDAGDVSRSEVVFPGARAYALAARSHALLALERPEQALAAAEQSMAIVAGLGVLEEGDAYVRLRHAEALHACGHHQAAFQAISDARDHLLAQARDMDDPRWREDFLHNVEEHLETLELADAWARHTE